MVNLFDYATKELSQDAFLMWFLMSDINDSGKKLIAKFIGRKDYKNISNIEVHAQASKIDITVDFEINGKKCVLIIEDKVGSNPHDNQLIKYMDVVNKWNNGDDSDRPSYFIYYKPRILSDFELGQIKEANDKYKNKGWEWKSFDINDIHNFFVAYKDSENLILNQYVEYISKIYEYCNIDKLPTENNIVEWENYFRKFIHDNVSSGKYDIYQATYRNRYAMIIVSCKGEENKNHPYLEIRSRDCLDGNVIGRILLYGKVLTDEEKAKYKKLIDEHSKMFKNEDYKQQLASTKKLSYKDENEFKDIVKNLIHEFIEITDLSDK